MPASPPRTLALHCHPDLPDGRVRGIAVTVARIPGAGLELAYRIEGDPAGLRLPDPARPLPPERLWAHTCCEAFVAAAGEAAYREFNFSPGGQWMRFDFAAYRQRSATPPGAPPALAVGRDPRGLTLTVRLPADQLPPGDWVLGLAAVVEHADGGLRYWALAHPPGRPDFHHRAGHLLTLPLS
jgi:hypothetical protein